MRSTEALQPPSVECGEIKADSPLLVPETRAIRSHSHLFLLAAAGVFVIDGGGGSLLKRRTVIIAKRMQYDRGVPQPSLFPRRLHQPSLFLRRLHQPSLFLIRLHPTIVVSARQCTNHIVVSETPVTFCNLSNPLCIFLSPKVEFRVEDSEKVQHL